MSFSKHLAAQALAREAMARTAAALRPGMSERDVAVLAEQEMYALGAERFWYHGVGALVLVGRERSRLSISGRDYRSSGDVFLQETDVVSVDLSPVLCGAWGDYARTIFLENGRAVLEPEQPVTPEFAEAYAMEQTLHRLLQKIVTAETTYHQVWERVNAFLRENGWSNLDFHGNLGHSIEDDPSNRIYLEEGNHTCLSAYGKPFTFEPHVCRTSGTLGVKREQIYYFDDNGRLAAM